MATTTQTVTATPATAAPAPAAPATRVVVTDPIHVERGHRTAWVVTGVAVVLLSAAGIVAATTASTGSTPPQTGAAVERTDAVESAHGHGSSIRTATGPAVAAVPALSAATGPVVHRTPPRGMVDAATTTQRSEGPRNVQPGQPLA